VWNVIREPLEIFYYDADEIQQDLAPNNRPQQALNDRVVQVMPPPALAAAAAAAPVAGRAAAVSQLRDVRLEERHKMIVAEQKKQEAAREAHEALERREQRREHRLEEAELAKRKALAEERVEQEVRRQAAKEREERKLLDAAQHKEEMEERKEREMLGRKARTAPAFREGKKARETPGRKTGAPALGREQEIKKMKQLLERDVLQDLRREKQVLFSDRQQEQKRARELGREGLNKDETQGGSGSAGAKDPRERGPSSSLPADAPHAVAYAQPQLIATTGPGGGVSTVSPAAGTPAIGRDLFDAFTDVASTAQGGHEHGEGEHHSEGERHRARARANMAVDAPGSKQRSHQASKESFAISRAIWDSISSNAKTPTAQQPASPHKAALQPASKHLLAKAVQEQQEEAAKNGKFLQHSEGGQKAV